MSLPAGCEADRYNPFRPDVCDDPYTVLSRAREEAPVFFHPGMNTWFLTRFEDVDAATRDAATFSSVQTKSLPPPTLEALAGLFPGGFPYQVASLVNSDPPEHGRLRNRFHRLFTARAVASWEQTVRTVVDDLIDNFATCGHADLVEAFCRPLAPRVTAAIFNMPEGSASRVTTFVDSWAQLHDPSLSAEEVTFHGHRLRDYHDLLTDLVRDRLEQPRDDLMTRIIQACRDEAEDALDDQQTLAVVTAFLLGGIEPPAHMVANAVHALFSHPDTMRRVRRDRGLIPAVVEETLRHRSPVLGLSRVTTRAVRVRGVEIPAGAVVQLMWASGNHDEERFPDAETFDIGRHDARRHLSFGAGVHYCIGAGLARLEGRVALERLLECLPGLRPDPDGVMELDKRPGMSGLARMDTMWEVER
ncbi:cytochrome P450 [Streptomyces sp. NPDC088752]|uniref:cytochrome P450 n=1 Tax=Streptomyces sp. NPDC088752 TaxID=3154963 RepID=UPI0034452867